ncbi:MAG: hypothetical protein Q8Q14_01835 [Gemmatimonadales bacterium]|nr:hypothetical protein [Gemmatimonadales bacterium]
MDMKIRPPLDYTVRRRLADGTILGRRKITPYEMSYPMFTWTHRFLGYVYLGGEDWKAYPLDTGEFDLINMRVTAELATQCRRLYYTAPTPAMAEGWAVLIPCQNPCCKVVPVIECAACGFASAQPNATYLHYCPGPAAASPDPGDDASRST